MKKPKYKNESQYTPWGGGYRAWNGKSPEVEFVEFLASFARNLRPKVVVETGLGQGYITRFVVKSCPKLCEYIAVESSEEYRVAFVLGDARVEVAAKVPDGKMEAADLVILDSSYSLRLAELQKWMEVGKPGSVCILHDVSKRHEPASIHHRLYKAVEKLDGVNRIYLKNPRGGVIITKA